MVVDDLAAYPHTTLCATLCPSILAVMIVLSIALGRKKPSATNNGSGVRD